MTSSPLVEDVDLINDEDSLYWEKDDSNPNQVIYDLENNKGYGTKKHMDGIKKYGISQWHRKSFGICKEF